LAYIATDREHKTYDLLTENDRPRRWRKLAFENLEIGAAYAAGEDLNENIARTDGGELDYRVL
jgi:hypothetical protein